MASINDQDASYPLVHDPKYYGDEMRCFVPSCKKYRRDNPQLSYLRVPQSLKEIWCEALERTCPKMPLYVCGEHINVDEDCYKVKSGMLRLKSTANLTLIRTYYDDVSEHDAQPGPSKDLDTRTPLDSAGREQDPLSLVIEQCRFCGEFSKDCVAVSGDMTYLAGNQTALALNDTRVQLDFNDRSLPNTVCRDCDAKLQEFCDFVQVVKAAQGTLINVAEEKEELETTTDVEENAEYEEAETLVVKTEYDSQPSEDSDDDKEGIADSITVGETIVLKETHKRKSNTDTAKPKKLKTKKKCEDDLVIDIKEEVVEKDANDGHGQSEVSDTGTDVKPSELELARSALVIEIAGDGTSEYQ